MRAALAEHFGCWKNPLDRPGFPGRSLWVNCYEIIGFSLLFPPFFFSQGLLYLYPPPLLWGLAPFQIFYPFFFDNLLSFFLSFSKNNKNTRPIRQLSCVNRHVANNQTRPRKRFFFIGLKTRENSANKTFFFKAPQKSQWNSCVKQFFGNHSRSNKPNNSRLISKRSFTIFYFPISRRGPGTIDWNPIPITKLLSLK